MPGPPVSLLLVLAVKTLMIDSNDRSETEIGVEFLVTNLSLASAKASYEASVAARVSLDVVLKEYRSNSITLLGLATGVAAFVGFSDLEASIFLFIASLLYVIAVGLVAAQFWPIDWKQFPTSASHLEFEKSTIRTDVDFFVAMTTENQAAFDHNNSTLSTVARRTALLLLVIGAMTATMIVATTQHPDGSSDRPIRVIVEEIGPGEGDGG